jgi:hypothetical protein
VAENGLVINNGATAGTRPPKSFELYVMGWKCRVDGEGLPRFAILACEVMETSSGRPRAPSPYFVGGLTIGMCSWDEKRRLLGLCNVDTTLSEIGSSKDVLTLHGISNPSDSLCALCRFRLGSPDFACNVLLLHPRSLPTDT